MIDRIQATSRNDETPVRELTPDELEQVGGGHSGGVNVVLGDGSVRGAVDAADYVVWRKSSSV